MQNKLAGIFANLYLPVIVCKNTPQLEIIYMNIKAALVFSPNYSTEQLNQKLINLSIKDVLEFAHEDEYNNFFKMIHNYGHIDNYKIEVLGFDGEKFTHSISANTASIESINDYILFYFTDNNNECASIEAYELKVAEMLNTSFWAGDMENSINTLLALAGHHVNASRVYIFEDISPTYTKNTYEWCAAGIEPMIDKLAKLEKEEYNYNIIAKSGMYITDDIRAIESEKDRNILEMQGIKALAIVTIYDRNIPLGYVGFDDCSNYRKWSHSEIQFLKSVAGMLAIFIKRRDADLQAQRTLEIMQIISDNTDGIIYANSIDDFTVKFVGAALLKELGKTADEVIGKKCWKVFQNQESMCSFCPVPKLMEMMQNGSNEVLTWEHTNENVGKTYLLHDKIIKWVDGEYVHIETGIDISSRFEYEKELKRIASTDSMTQAYNREWGGKILTEKLSCSSARGSLCFLDIDGLKYTNDTFGHDAGDDMLKKTVEIIRSHLNTNEIICRWGGDEFLLWLDRDVVEASELIKKLQKEMHQFNKEKKAVYKLSFSYGIVAFIQDINTSFEILVARADEMMYKNKMKKRGLIKKRRRTD